ncbi:hypothetical protein EG329_006484 [Mollisiaceae sp. DMI_Dod_QoI]|nr:hypothetical protein EG329_006484 [Helotiales sp. DMI_Dod_QoI]
MSSESPHVGIVGAGISGLRCAEVLLKHGFRVTILEARDRIGGRICQSDKLGYRADIGPNWSGEEGRHPIIDLAKKTNTPLHAWNDKQNIYDSSGQLLPEEKSDKLSSLLWQFIEEAFKYSVDNGEKISESESLYDFITSKAKEQFPDESDRELLLQMSQIWGAYVGDPVAKQSLKFSWLEECCGGEGEMFVESTWEGILGEIAKTPLEKANILLKEKIVEVQTSHRNTERSKVRVTTEKGGTWSFDEVLMTTPLGWLKRNKEAFKPALPTRLLAGIDAISVGHLEKVYITFPSAFWVDEPSSPLPLGLSPEKRAAEDIFPSYTNWLSPSYSATTNPSQWPVECWNLASFTPPNRHPTLIFYLYGDCSEYLTTLVHQKSTEEHYSLLNEFFKPYYSRLSHYDAQNLDCQPKAILSTEWQKDELSGFGSYCNFQVGIKDAAGDVEAIRFGVPEQKLWFAGEHTSPFEELGTVAGAYLSGESVALRILDCYGVKGTVE